MFSLVQAVAVERHLPNNRSITNWTPRANAFSSSCTDLQSILTPFRYKKCLHSS